MNVWTDQSVSGYIYRREVQAVASQITTVITTVNDQENIL